MANKCSFEVGLTRMSLIPNLHCYSADLIKASGQQNISGDLTALSITSGLFQTEAAKDSVHKTAIQAINTLLCGVIRTACMCHKRSDT